MILFKKTKIWEEGGGKQLYHQKDKEYDQYCPLHHTPERVS